MVICIGVGLTLLGNLVPGLVFGWFLACSSCARDVGLFFVFVLVLFAYPGCGVLLGCFVGCGRMWVLGLLFSFVWLFVLVEPVCG